jgi:hypothetical protein
LSHWLRLVALFCLNVTLAAREFNPQESLLLHF